MGADDQKLVGSILERQSKMKTKRTNFERYWHEVGRLVMPRTDDFIVTRYPGQRRDEWIFDSTAVLALPRFAAAVESLITPRSQKWHGIAPMDYRLKDDLVVKAWCERVRDILFAVRYAPRANFAGQSNEVYMGLGAYGNGSLFVEDGLSEGIKYQNVPLSELFYEEDAQGNIDTIHRLYKKSVRQAMQKWGDAVPEEISKHAEKDPDREFEFLHIVQPQGERDIQKRTYRGMKFISFDIAFEQKALMRTGGYRTQCYAVSRYVTANREVYGRSPAMEALADIRTLNEMSKTGLRYGQLVTDPPWLTYDVDSLSPFSVRPGAVNAGYLNERGEPYAKPLQPGGKPEFTLEMMNQRRESVNTGFLITLFQILVDDKSRMTATEVMERAQEKGALLAPTMGRQQADFLDPIIERELDILNHAGALPPMPEQLRRAGGAVKIAYDSPLSRAQRAEEGAGIMRTVEAVTPIAQVDQSVLQRFNFDRMVVRLAEIFGAPADILLTDQEMAIKKQQMIQAQQMQNAVQALPAVSGAAKDFSQAAQQAQGAQV